MPSLGASEFNFDRTLLNNQVGGADRNLTKVLLQAPGVTQDSYGSIHVRNEHSNLQYRLNGVIVPESISGFGQTFAAVRGESRVLWRDSKDVLIGRRFGPYDRREKTIGNDGDSEPPLG